jgi:hypothetical protein
MSNTEGSHIEADADATSDYESVKSDTTSVTSSIFNHVFENGHSYHAYKAGQYVSNAIKTYPYEANLSSFCQTMNLSKGD